jgi:hypothetical protein
MAIWSIMPDGDGWLFLSLLGERLTLAGRRDMLNLHTDLHSRLQHNREGGSGHALDD